MRRMRRDPVDDMFDRMQNLFEEFHDKGKEITGLGGIPVDVQEDGDQLIVKADIPGVTKEDISLKADAERLEISAESTGEMKEENEKYFRKERHSRTFRRSVNWPKAIDPETIEASYDEGVLTVTADKEKSSGRDIEIE